MPPFFSTELTDSIGTSRALARQNLSTRDFFFPFLLRLSNYDRSARATSSLRTAETANFAPFWRSLARRLNRAFEISASREANAFRGAVSSRRSKSSAFPWIMRSIGRSSRCVYVFVKLVANELGWQTGNVDQGTIDEIKVTMGKPQPLLL